MTERALALPAETAGATSATSLARARLRTVPSEVVAPRPAPAARRPVHVAVTVGVAAGLYAVSLAGVTGLQAGTDARLAAERAPAAEAVAALRTSHDATEAELARIEAAYAGAAAAYASLTDGMATHETALGALGSKVAKIEGSTASLRVPTVRLPTVSSRATVVASRPRTNACTTASGQPC